MRSITMDCIKSIQIEQDTMTFEIVQLRFQVAASVPTDTFIIAILFAEIELTACPVVIGRFFEKVGVIRLSWTRSNTQRLGRQVFSTLLVDLACDLVFCRVEAREAGVIKG